MVEKANSYLIMEKWSRGYAFVKILVYYTFWLSHKRIVVLGSKNIPKDKPIIFAPNHQNALMDPLAVLLTNHTQPVWLARADIFKVKFTRSILKFLKIVPVYRIRDGKENLQNNDETFALAIRVLKNKQAMALFPEAAHTGKRQMIEHKKAIPRIAFLAEDKNNFQLGVQIVPVGIYYSHYWNFNRSVIVNYGAPINVDGYKKAFHENEHAASIALRDEIYSALLPLTLNIHSREFYDEYEKIGELAGKRFAKSRHYSEDEFINRFFSDKELVEKLEIFEKQDPDTFGNLISGLRLFYKSAKQLGLSGEQVRKIRKRDFIMFLLRMTAGVLSLPLFLFGFIFSGPQFLISRYIVRKKVNDPIFRSTFNMVIGMILFPISYLILSIALGLLLQSVSLAVFLFLIMPLFGKLAYQLFEFYRHIFLQFKITCISVFRRKQVASLLRQKRELEDKIIDVADNSIIFEP